MGALPGKTPNKPDLSIGNLGRFSTFYRKCDRCGVVDCGGGTISEPREFSAQLC